MKIPAVKMPPPQVEQPELYDVAKQFEAIFTQQMIKAMRDTVQEGGLVPRSQAEKVFQSMLDGDYAQQMADSEQLGLAKVLYEQLLRNLR